MTGDDDVIDTLYARARELDQEAWAERDRLWAERGANPDWLGERPWNEAEKRMMERRLHSIRMASDEELCAGDPAIATALRMLEAATKH
jgi:hypothetical protein